MAKVIILDYKLGNLFSVHQACYKLGIDAKISMKPEDISKADGLIIPGVGAFNEAMNNLYELGFVEPIKSFVNSGKPLLGVCLGLQLLFDNSDEFGESKGLGLISGSVLKFPKDYHKEKLLIPQIGWNSIKGNFENSPLYNIKQDEYFYFVHSFYVKPKKDEVVLSNTYYRGFKYCSSILMNNIFATQFHPEKSGKEGLKIYKNWASHFKI